MLGRDCSIQNFAFMVLLLVQLGFILRPEGQESTTNPPDFFVMIKIVSIVHKLILRKEPSLLLQSVRDDILSPSYSVFSVTIQAWVWEADSVCYGVSLVN